MKDRLLATDAVSSPDTPKSAAGRTDSYQPQDRTYLPPQRAGYTRQGLGLATAVPNKARPLF